MPDNSLMDGQRSWDSGVCPVCGTHEAIFVREAYDDRYGQPDLFALMTCTQCGHCMTAPRLPEESLAALYGTYYPRKHLVAEDIRREAGHSVTAFAALRRWWMGTDNQGQYTARSGDVMLDVGCGSGLSLLEARARGAQARGIEADPNVRRLADELDLPIYVGRLVDAPLSGEQFDLITLNQVIEHIPEPDRLLVYLRDHLRHDGRMVLVFPNVGSFWCRIFGARWINWHVPYHLHHFSREGFARLASRCGYRVRAARTITPNLWTILQFQTLRGTASRGAPGPMWAVTPKAGRDTDAVSGRRRNVSRGLRRVLGVVILIPLAIVNRVVDALGLGDSLMVEIVAVEHT